MASTRTRDPNDRMWTTEPHKCVSRSRSTAKPVDARTAPSDRARSVVGEVLFAELHTRLPQPRGLHPHRSPLKHHRSVDVAYAVTLHARRTSTCNEERPREAAGSTSRPTKSELPSSPLRPQQHALPLHPAGRRTPSTHLHPPRHDHHRDPNRDDPHHPNPTGEPPGYPKNEPDHPHRHPGAAQAGQHPGRHANVQQRPPGVQS